MSTPIRKVIYCLITVAVTATVHADDAWLKLHGQLSQGAVRLYWDTSKWPQDLEGFHVKRRLTTDTRNPERWQRLTSKPVSPSLSLERNWQDLGLNQDQTNEARRALQEVLQLGKANPLTNAETLARLREADGLKDGDRIRLMQNYFLAVSNGFGYIDNTLPAEQEADYGLFYVDAKGREKPSPIAIFSTKRHRTPARPDPKRYLEAGRAGNNVTLNWRYALRNSDSEDIIGFHVYRRPLDGDRFRKLMNGVVAKYKTEKGYLHWRFLDNSADPSKSFVYKIAAVDYFQSEFLETQVTYDAEKFRPLQPVVIQSVTRTDDDHVKITWESPREDRPRIAAFVVERSAKDEAPVAVSPRLSNYDNEYVDEFPKTHETAYEYRIISIDNYGQFHYSAKKPILYLGQPKPPQPTGLAAKFLYQDNMAFVELSWDAKVADDALTHGYRLGADVHVPGTIQDQAGIPLITDNRYRFRVYKGGRNYTFHLSAVTKTGGRSPHLDVSCYVPVFKVPKVPRFTARVLPKGQVQLDWEYPIFQDLEGFRIMMNGLEIAGEDQVSANVRGWLVATPERAQDSRSGNFTIAAVSAINVSEPTLPRFLVLPDRVMAYHETPPTNLTAELDLESGKPVAKLQWDSIAEGEDAGLLGYVLSVDYDEPGRVRLLSGMPLIKQGKVEYPLPSLDRDAYTFRVAAMDRSRNVGPYAEVMLKLK